MKRILIFVLILVGVGALYIAWYLASPLFLNRTVNEGFPPADMPKGQISEPELLVSGQFVDGDGFHMGSGSASIYRLPDGSRTLRFENFEVTNGPDLRVWLAGESNPENREDLDRGGYVELGKLKGNIGDQNYEVPADIDLSAYNSVVIYCKPFHVVFSVATLGS